ncbi:MAG: hypothetical protein SCJ97_09945 [Bacillota bacterium]|nr:hypothetical protein [Bacillota bacterium]
MFLKEFAIGRYGPLSEIGVLKLGSFNLFYGSNEDGKTLTIDALLKMLFGKKAGRYFSALNRVTENPEGYLLLSERNGEEIKLPEAGSLSDFYPVSAAEFSNIFVIRDSDLAIKGEDDFYRNITARLTGMRTEEIANIKKKLSELGGITEKGAISNTAPEKLKDRYQQALALTDRIESLLIELEEENFSSFEEELAFLKERSSGMVELKKMYDAALSRERYEKGNEALRKIDEIENNLVKYKNYDEAELESWRRSESSLDFLKAEKKKHEEEYDRSKESLTRAGTESKNLSLAHSTAKHEYETAFNQLNPLIEQHDQQSQVYRKREVLTGSKTLKSVSVLALLLFAISVTGLIIRPIWWFHLFLAVSLGYGLFIGWLRFNLLGLKARLAGQEASLCQKAERLGLSAAGIAAVRTALGTKSRELVIAESRLNEAVKEVEWHQKELDRVEKDLDDLMQRIKSEEAKVNNLKEANAVSALAELETLIGEKGKMHSEIKVQKNILESHFGLDKSVNRGANDINYWVEKVDNLARFADSAEGIIYNQKEVDRLSDELEEVNNKLNLLNEKFGERKEELREIERLVNEVFDYEGGYLPCQTTVDLNAINIKLLGWIKVLEQNRDSALAALEILSELEDEEEEKVHQLFSPESSLHANFARITGGRYREVRFQGGENPIMVVNTEGNILEASSLSGGTFDQLYFAVRIALGEAVLKENRGFLILDDPFIKADPVRLGLLMEMLADINSSGWQILYFSSKGEVKNTLQERIDRKEIREFAIS